MARCGLEVIELEADAEFPDSVFVEDTAVLTERCAVVTRPGAASRRGEIVNMAATLAQYYDRLDRVEPPGTIDGGDVCQIGDHFLIGISDRTNEEGARQLIAHLRAAGYTGETIDIRGMDGLLHLKSGITYLGDGRVLVADALAGEKVLAGYELVRAPQGEEYAANCIRVNDHVLVAAGFRKVRDQLVGLGYSVLELEMSEFQKQDGGLSCLSLRF